MKRKSYLVIRQTKSNETNHYIFSGIKINLQGVNWFYKINPNYREAVAENSNSYNLVTITSKDRDDADAADADSDFAELLNLILLMNCSMIC